MINNENYLKEELLQEELQFIFHDNWFFVGLTDRLGEKYDYITYDCGSISLFVQNFGEKLKSYSNICLHRFNKIHCENEGNAFPLCSYHSWAYDKEGNPMVKSNLREELTLCGRRKLDEYEVEICGKFIFVRVNKNKSEGLRDYLGPFYNKLLDLSSHFDGIINAETIILKHQANWKLLVENVLECDHCGSVHKETLVPIGIGAGKPENHYFENGHDIVDYPIKKSDSQLFRERKLSFLNKTTYLHASLQHMYIFPNLFISSTAGNLFYIGILKPVKSGITDLCAQFVQPKYMDLTSREEILLNAYKITSLESSLKVINEDRNILERIQKHLSIVKDQKQIFGDGEFRIKIFHQKIVQLVNYI